MTGNPSGEGEGLLVQRTLGSTREAEAPQGHPSDEEGPLINCLLWTPGSSLQEKLQPAACLKGRGIDFPTQGQSPDGTAQIVLQGRETEGGEQQWLRVG